MQLLRTTIALTNLGEYATPMVSHDNHGYEQRVRPVLHPDNHHQPASISLLFSRQEKQM